MRVLVVHPVMTMLGGGERLCCDTIRVLKSQGHEVTILSEVFDPKKVESFFGYQGLFDRINLLLYPPGKKGESLGSTPHLIHNLRGQQRALGHRRHLGADMFDLVFSTQEPGYIPDTNLPVIQWGYFPRYFPHHFRKKLARTIRALPVRLHYRRKISRIALVLAISQYSKSHLDKEWKRPSMLVYPSCNMISPREKRDLVVTVGRASPEKRLELFWRVARQRPEYEFAMLLTQDPRNEEYSIALSKASPDNGRAILNAPKEMYEMLLGEAKAYVHFTVGEHFGIAIVEAMSTGCVPVVHDSGGPKEIVGDAIGIRWHNVKDIPDMVDRAMRASPSQATKQRAKDFSRTIFEKRLSSIFAELHV